MANKYLAREDAPFGEEVWETLDAAMVQTAKQQLAGRRLLEIEGPYGLGLKSIPLPDAATEDGFIIGAAQPVVWIRRDFELGLRDLVNYEREKISLSVLPVIEATRACAQMEDELIFNGAGDAPGLLTVEGAHDFELSPWEEVGTAGKDIIEAITVLDKAGFHGPYTLALAPERYNLLLRLYERGNRSEMEHVKAMVSDGVVKAPAIESGGVLLASGRQYASIVLGQDLSLGFIGPAGDKVEFFVSESLALRLRMPEAICRLH
ncbi:MAG: family 1 encapsulin nanocompartment shell protein [Anaerolineae bacterium]